MIWPKPEADLLLTLLQSCSWGKPPRPSGFGSRSTWGNPKTAQYPHFALLTSAKRYKLVLAEGLTLSQLEINSEGNNGLISINNQLVATLVEVDAALILAADIFV